MGRCVIRRWRGKVKGKERGRKEGRDEKGGSGE